MNPALNPITRGHFLRLSGGGVAAFVAASGLMQLGLSNCASRVPGPELKIDKLNIFADHAETLKALFHRFIGRERALQIMPESDFNAAVQKAVVALDYYMGEIGELMPGVVDELGSALTLVEYGSLPALGSRFTRLDPPDQDAYIRDFMTSNIQIKRDVFMALKGLLTLVYYDQIEAYQHIGYAPATLPRSIVQAAYEG